MIIGVVGLGLIGGSMAKAINQNTGNSVYGFDIDDTVSKKAILVDATEGILTEDMLSECDMLILGLYPEDTVEYVKSVAGKLKEGCMVVDTCGIKKYVCDELFKTAKEHGFHFIGGHPMAGVEHTGFEYSKKALFLGASMILIPPTGMPIEIVDKVSKFFKAVGFAETPVVDAGTHDRIIAYTSQLAHVVSSAYVKSDTATEHEGFSAGSYEDMTRVAKLKEDMWTELFLENSDFLSAEIDGLIERLKEYSRAIKDNDATTLHEMLKEGRERKLEIDKEIF